MMNLQLVQHVCYLHVALLLSLLYDEAYTWYSVLHCTSYYTVLCNNHNNQQQMISSKQCSCR
jgi:hypothetical protein